MRGRVVQYAAERDAMLRAKPPRPRGATDEQYAALQRACAQDLQVPHPSLTHPFVRYSSFLTHIEEGQCCHVAWLVGAFLPRSMVGSAAHTRPLQNSAARKR